MTQEAIAKNRYVVVNLKEDNRAFLVEFATEHMTLDDWEVIQRHVVLARSKMEGHPLFYAFSLDNLDHINPTFVRGLMMMWRFIGMRIGVHACLCDCRRQTLFALRLYKIQFLFNIYRTRQDAFRHLGLKAGV